jgi:hypothetical protein
VFDFADGDRRAPSTARQFFLRQIEGSAVFADEAAKRLVGVHKTF